jgi:hypothetical protein
VFEDYIRDNVDSWFSFAQRRRLDVERMEDLILVTGCTLVTSWGVAAFIDSNQDAEVLLRFRGSVYDWRELRPSVAYQSSNPVRPHDQYYCSFTKCSTDLKAQHIPEPMRVYQRVPSEACPNMDQT